MFRERKNTKESKQNTSNTENDPISIGFNPRIYVSAEAAMKGLLDGKIGKKTCIPERKFGFLLRCPDLMAKLKEIRWFGDILSVACLAEL